MFCARKQVQEWKYQKERPKTSKSVGGGRNYALCSYLYNYTYLKGENIEYLQGLYINISRKVNAFMTFIPNTQYTLIRKMNKLYV